MTTQPPAPKRDLRVPPPTPWERSRAKVFALLLLVIVFGLFALSSMAYAHVFESSIPVHLKTDRAGLQMHVNNRVKVNGVDLGRVAAVTLDEDGKQVDIELALKPDLAESLPSNVSVELAQLTAFGNKAVQFRLPATPSGEKLAAGSVIPVEHVTSEINTTFDSLMTLLNRVQPAKLNAVLGGFANALQGNGETMGQTITQANAYLKKFNPELTPLKRDWRSAGGFSDVYAGAGDAIADTIRNTGVLARTVSDKRSNLENLLVQTGMAGDEIASSFTAWGGWARSAIKQLRPTTTLLDEYAPMLTCFIDGEAVTYDMLDKKLWNAAGANFEINVVEPGTMDQYHYPRDLPENGPGKEKGPNCRGLPVVSASEDSLADYTTGPPSLLQRTTDNSPRLALAPGQQIPNPPIYQTPASNQLTRLRAQWPYMTPVQKFFGPYDAAPGAPLLRGGK
jgi:phospholipid/cholesterol/gamma-HCH transport system substrate-binding protein